MARFHKLTGSLKLHTSVGPVTVEIDAPVGKGSEGGVPDTPDGIALAVADKVRRQLDALRVGEHPRLLGDLEKAQSQAAAAETALAESEEKRVALGRRVAELESKLSDTGLGEAEPQQQPKAKRSKKS